MTTLQTLSLIGLLLYFAILLTAVLREKKNENVSDYFFGGRSLPFWALSITFIASWWGAGSALSTADLAFNDGIGAFWYYGMPVLFATALIIVFSKAIRRVGYFTQGQMMEARYNKTVAYLTSIFILVFMVLSAASQMVGVGDFFGSYLGIKYEWAVLLGTSIVLIYSFFGGFRGVVLTDIIQFVLLLLSAIVVFVAAVYLSGGVSNVIDIATATGKPDFFDFGAGFSKYSAYVITFGCSWMIGANVWQRISAAKTNIDAKKMTVMSFIAYIPLYLIVVLTGMASIAIFTTFPTGGVVSGIVTTHLNPYLGAFVFVGISAAIMSTMDSLINTGAMTFSMDLITKEYSESKKLSISQFATLGISIVALFISLKIRSILEITWIASDLLTTGVFIPLVVGFFWKRGNSYGAMGSMIFAIIFCSYNLFISFGFDLPAFWEFQSALQVATGLITSLIIYITVSLLTKSDLAKATAFIEKAGLFKKKID